MKEYTYIVTFRHTVNMFEPKKSLSRAMTTEEVNARNVVSAINAINRIYQEVEIIECKIMTTHGHDSKRLM